MATTCKYNELFGKIALSRALRVYEFLLPLRGYRKHLTKSYESSYYHGLDQRP